MWFFIAKILSLAYLQKPHPPSPVGFPGEPRYYGDNFSNLIKILWQLKFEFVDFVSIKHLDSALPQCQFRQLDPPILAFFCRISTVITVVKLILLFQIVVL